MTLRKFLFWTHLILGLSAGSVICVVALTGAALSFEPQIVEFAERDVRQVSVPTDAGRLDMDTLLEKARQTKPNAKVASLAWRPEADASVMVGFGKDGGVLYLNPYDGAVLGGQSKTHDFMHWVEDLHRKLTAGEVGKRITGISCLMMLGLSLSGLWLWWPKHWKWRAMKPHLTFMRNWRGKARDWNWHNAIGFWCMPLLVMLTLTGTIMSFQWANDLLYKATGNTPPPPKQRATTARSERAAAPSANKNTVHGDANAPREKRPARPIAALVAKAEAQVPGWQAILLRFPKPGENFTFTITEPAGVNPSPRSQLTLDPATAETVKWEPADGQNLGRKLRYWTKILHTGEGGRWPLRLALLLTSLGTLMLIWTGFAMSWRRFFGKKKNATA